MPLMKLQVSVPVPDNKKEDLLKAASQILSRCTGKPESYVMVTLGHAEAVCMAGKVALGAYVDVRGIGGFNSKVNNQLTKETCDLLKQKLGIAPENVYITFTDVPAQNWGWKGSTFG